MGTGAVPEHAGRKLGRGHFLRAAEEYLPTGGQFGIVHGDQSAIVTEVGATLRSFPVAGLELLVTFGVADGPLPRIFGDSRVGPAKPLYVSRSLFTTENDCL